MNILVAMSGGVDSSVAAQLLVEKGNSCIGVTMKLYANEDLGISRGHTCCSLDDTIDAKAVAWRLGMKHYTLNFAEGFRETVMAKFAASYLKGETPNPCIDCNRYMKFDKLMREAEMLGCEAVATGHYARIDCVDGKYRLKKALDESKDQSYVLYNLTQFQLAHTLFPLGELSKSETRALAREGGFLNADKPDSQDICFAPDGDYAAAIERFCGKRCSRGCFVDTQGKVLGEHAGIVHYTLGQHRGLGIDLPGKRYVCAINAADNTVTLGEAKDLYSSSAIVRDVNWISGETPQGPFHCAVKTRYRQREQGTTVTPLPDGTIRLDFDEPQRAVTPGQAAVLYDGELVLGGGTLASAEKAVL